jgi:hypothetical protein
LIQQLSHGRSFISFGRNRSCPQIEAGGIVWATHPFRDTGNGLNVIWRVPVPHLHSSDRHHAVSSARDGREIRIGRRASPAASGRASCFDRRGRLLGLGGRFEVGDALADCAARRDPPHAAVRLRR